MYTCKVETDQLAYCNVETDQLAYLGCAHLYLTLKWPVNNAGRAKVEARLQIYTKACSSHVNVVGCCSSFPHL